MSIFSKLNKPKAEPDPVVVTIAGRHTDSRLHPDSVLEDLEDSLVAVLEGTGFGDFDIVESTRASAIVYLSGPDGEALYRCIRTVLESSAICDGATVEITHGTQKREVRVQYKPLNEQAG